MRNLLCGTLLFALITGTASAQSEPSRKDPLFKWMLGSYVALQAVDVHLTHEGTRMGLVESNPVFGSGESVTTAKAVIAPLTAWGLVRLHRKHPRLATGLTIGLNVLYAGVAIHNRGVIREASEE